MGISAGAEREGSVPGGECGVGVRVMAGAGWGQCRGWEGLSGTGALRGIGGWGEGVRDRRGAAEGGSVPGEAEGCR